MPLNPISPAFIGVPVQGPPGPAGSGGGGGTTTVGSYTQPVHNATVSVTLADASGATLLGAVTVTDPTAGNQFYTCTAVAGSVATLLNYSPGNTTSGTIAAGSKVTFGGPGAGIASTAINEGQTQAIVNGVLSPVGHARVYNVASYYLTSDAGDWTRPVQAACDAALANGGGTVLFPNSASVYNIFQPILVGVGVNVIGESKIGVTISGNFYGPAFIGMSLPNGATPTLQTHSGITFLRASNSSLNTPWINLADAAATSLKGKAALSIECFVYSISGQSSGRALFFSRGIRGSRPQDTSTALYVTLGTGGNLTAALRTSAAGGSSTLGGGGFTQLQYGYKNAITIQVASSAGAVVGEYATVIASPVTVSGAVNNGSGLVRLTATAHGRSTGDQVLVAGVGGTTEANGIWLVNVVDANHLDLQLSAFANTFASNGTVGQASTYLIRAVPDGTHITIQNLEPTPTGIVNLAPGTAIASGSITYSGPVSLSFAGAIPNSPAAPTKIEFTYDGSNIGLWAGPAGGTCTFLGRVACAGVIVQNHWEVFSLANDFNVPFAGVSFGAPDVDYASPRISSVARHSPTTGANYTAESAQLVFDAQSAVCADFSTLYRGKFVHAYTQDPYGGNINVWFNVRNVSIFNTQNIAFKHLTVGSRGPGILLESVLKYTIEDVGIIGAAGLHIDNNCYPGVIDKLDIQASTNTDARGLPVWNGYGLSLTRNAVIGNIRSISLTYVGSTGILVSSSGGDFNNVYATFVGGAIGVYVNNVGFVRAQAVFQGCIVGDEGGSLDEAAFWIYGSLTGSQIPSGCKFTSHDTMAQAAVRLGVEAYHVDGMSRVNIDGFIDVQGASVGLAVVRSPDCGLLYDATSSNIGGPIVDITQAALVAAPSYEGNACAPIVPGNTTKTITGAANNGSGLIRITATAHGRSNGDWVTIVGVTGTVEANGSWQLSGVAANTFDLVGSTFTNAYVSGGTSTQDALVSVNDSLWGTYRVAPGSNTTAINIQRPYLTGRRFLLVNDNAQSVTYRRPGGGGTGATVAAGHSAYVRESVTANDVLLVG